MADETEKIINREIKKLGALGGGVGGAVAGLAGAAGGAVGGAAGALFAAQHLPVVSAHEERDTVLSPEEALGEAVRILTRLGHLMDGLLEDAPFPHVSARIGSGWFNLNPTVIHFEIIEAGEKGCRVRVTAMAKEGLISQKSSPKALARFWKAWPESPVSGKV